VLLFIEADALLNTSKTDEPESNIFTPLMEAENDVAAALVKFKVAEAEVAAIDDGIKEDVAGVQLVIVLPLTTLVTSNEVPPLLK
jgi:hypothetical protein